MAPKPFHLLFLDLETTGNESLKLFEYALIPWHEIIEIGAVAVRQPDLTIIDELELKILPLFLGRSDPQALQINGYKERSAKGEWDSAVSLPSALQILLVFCKNTGPAILTGHNFSFDWNFLSVAFAWMNISEEKWGKAFHYSRIDTRSVAIGAMLTPTESLSIADYSLRNNRLSEKLGIPNEPYPHSALNGAKQSYLVYKKIQETKG